MNSCIEPGHYPLPSSSNVSIHGHCSIVYLCLKSEPRYDPPAELTVSPLTEKTPNLPPTPDSTPSACENDTDTLLLAASRGDVEKIKGLIHNGADPNAEQNRNTPLIQSAISGTESVTEILLGVDDINVNYQNDAGQSALWCAAHDGNSAIVKLLLEKEGILIECKAEDGFTPLATAAVEGHKKVVELLLAKGANTEARDNTWNMTPISWAGRVGNVETFKVLWKFGRCLPARASGAVPNWAAKM